jgi:hypothetical protein
MMVLFGRARLRNAEELRRPFEKAGLPKLRFIETAFPNTIMEGACQ